MGVLVLGASGLLGSNVVAAARERGRTVAGTYHTTEPGLDVPVRQLDLRDGDAVHEVVAAVEPEWVVNCAAATDVDGCESAPGLARAVNAKAPGVVAEACQAAGSDLLHVSTDYVFDGQGGGYAEDDAPAPIQTYGETKLAGEQAVRERHARPLVVRPSFVYGVHRGRDELAGFPAWVRSELEEESEIPLFVDQRVTPSRAGSTAAALLDLLDAGVSGTFHLACRSCVTPHEFGAVIAERMGADSDLLREGSLADLDRPAPRPPNICLDVSNVESRLDRPQPTLAEDLDAISGHL